MDLFRDDESGGAPEFLEAPDADLLLFRHLDLGAPEAEVFRSLLDAVAWRREQITLFGKTHWQPRLLAWYGDPDASYRYSGKRYDPQPWLPELDDLRARVEAVSGARFNSVLANLYRDGNDSMGLHADDEPELGENPVIASLSLGEERVFRLKHRTRQDLRPLRLPLPGGSLLVMRGPTQRYWKHEVPKSRRPCGPRINLTFRLVHARSEPVSRG